MQELLRRLAALDPDASAELRVIDHFDALTEQHAGLEAFVRAAAVLADCPAGLMDASRRLRIRVLPDGQRSDGAPAGLVVPLRDEGPSCVWLERDEASGRHNDVIVLERLGRGVRVVLDRTRVTSSADPALVELLVDPDVELTDRQSAARRLGLPLSAALLVVASTPSDLNPQGLSARIGPLEVAVEVAGSPRAPLPCRAGIGTPKPLERLHESFEEARAALRLTAAGTPADPGPTCLDAAQLGGLLALAFAPDSAIARQEVLCLDRLVSLYPWALATLGALSAESSLRSVASMLHIHHSTIQNRIQLLEKSLGYSLRAQSGRCRACAAVYLRRARDNRF